MRRQESYQRTGLRGSSSSRSSFPLRNPQPFYFSTEKDRTFLFRSIRGFQRGKRRKSIILYMFSRFPFWSWEESGKPTKRFPAALCILSRRRESMTSPHNYRAITKKEDCFRSPLSYFLSSWVRWPAGTFLPRGTTDRCVPCRSCPAQRTEDRSCPSPRIRR